MPPHALDAFGQDATLVQEHAGVRVLALDSRQARVEVCVCVRGRNGPGTVQLSSETIHEPLNRVNGCSHDIGWQQARQNEKAFVEELRVLLRGEWACCRIVRRSPPCHYLL